MLEKVPRPLGSALSALRSGLDKIASLSELAALPETITVESPLFGSGEPMPSRFTADGAGISPPLAWSSVPSDTTSLVLLVEDADAPSPKPLVHCIAVDLPQESGGIPEGVLTEQAARQLGIRLGKNSLLKAEWLPPDPPPGHGVHRYVFQLFALRQRPPHRDSAPGRAQIVEMTRCHGIARGMFIGIYKRD